MSKFYYDCEFLEGTQKKLFGHTKPTIDLISIGIVSEDNREYYAISKDFNLKEAWNRFDLKDGKKVYWIRENVLKPIYKELRIKELNEQYGDVSDMECYFRDRKYFKQLKRLIKKYGKSNKQIASEIVEFCKPMYRGYSLDGPDRQTIGSVYISSEPISPEDINKWGLKYIFQKSNPIFYAYYGAYDHVALCWLFGKMIDLPKGFPMYSIDLKQMLDERQRWRSNYRARVLEYTGEFNKEDMLRQCTPENIKEMNGYPTQQNAHNALDDARFNKKLHEFIQSL